MTIISAKFLVASSSNRRLRREITAFRKRIGRSPLVAIFSENEGTLGHEGTMSIIAKRIREAGGEVIIVSGDIEGKVFDLGDTLKKLPPVIHDHSGKNVDLNPDGTPYLGSQRQEERKQALLGIIGGLNLDAVVFEHHPLCWKDYRAPDVQTMLEYYREAKRSTPFIAMGMDTDTMRAKENRLKDFSRLLVHGWADMQLYDTGTGQSCRVSEAPPEAVREKTDFLGHIMVDKPPKNWSLWPHKRPVMVFSSGSFLESDKLFFDRAIEAYKLSGLKKYPWKIVISQGCPPDIFKQLQSRAEEVGAGKITVTHTYDSTVFEKDMAKCKAAITRGSHNATLGLAFRRRRGRLLRQFGFVVVPRTGPGFGFEFDNRATFLEKAGFAVRVTEGTLMKENGANLLAGALRKSMTVKPPKKLKYEDGSQFASKIIQIAMGNPAIQTRPRRSRRHKFFPGI